MPINVSSSSTWSRSRAAILPCSGASGTFFRCRSASSVRHKGGSASRRFQCSAEPEAEKEKNRFQGDIINRFATCLCASTFSIFVICPGTTPSTIDVFIQTEVFGLRSSSAVASAPAPSDRPAPSVAPSLPVVTFPPAKPATIYPPSSDSTYTTVIPLVKDRPREDVGELNPAEREKFDREKAEKDRADRERADKARADAERLLKEKEEQARKEKEKKALEEKLRKQKEKEKKDREEAARRAEVRKKAAEARRRQYEREALIAGGSVGLGFFSLAKWPVILELFGAAFRLIGGPTLVSAALRTPGYILGKNLRLVEWDLQRSPSHPDGQLVTINLRQFTSTGLRTAIAKAYNLESPKQVKQIAHWILIGPHFYEQTGPQQSLVSLPDNAMIVWTQVSPSQLVMPSRGDRLPTQAVAGVSKELALQNNNTEPQTDMLRAIAALAALSRGEKDVIIAQESRREAERSRDESPNRKDASSAESSNGSSRNGASASKSTDSDDEGRDDYVNGGLFAWFSNLRGRGKSSAKPAPAAIHGYSESEASAARENATSANGSWQVLAEVRRRADAIGGGGGGVSTLPVPPVVSTSAGVVTQEALTVKAELPTPPTEAKEPLDASKKAVSWPMLKRVGLSNVRLPSSFEPISVGLEERMVGIAASGDPGLLRLFEAFAMQDVFRFIQYARAYVDSRTPLDK